MAAEALTDYEIERQRRVEENKRKLAQLGLPQMMNEMQQAAGQAAEHAPKRKRRPAAEQAEALEPTRRSKRTEGRERPCYVFEAERGSGGSRPPRDGPLVKEGECEEVYGLQHVLALGSHRQEWEMFTDGYNEEGERIYDPDKGLSCHQCRQKTLGQRTSCSRCKSGLGVLCGDCLFARYGENVEEAAANPAWVCPCCRDLCNCSRHRKLRKWEATGQLHRSVKARGYLSVAHYLVLNKARGLAAKRAALASGFCPPDLTEKLQGEVEELEAAGAEAAELAPAELAAEEQQQAGAAAAAKKGGRRKAAAAAGKGAEGKQRAAGKGGSGRKQKAGKAAGAGNGAEGATVKAASGGKKGRKTKRKPASPAGPPAAAAGALEASGSSGSSLAASEGGPEAAVTTAPPAGAAAAEAAAAVQAAHGKGGRRGQGRKAAAVEAAGLPGASTLEAVVAAAPARKWRGRR